MESFDLSLDVCKRYPLLTAEDEIHLGREVQAMMRLLEAKPEGPYSKAERKIIRIGSKAKDRMVASNLRLVAHVCGRYHRAIAVLSLQPEDLLQEGTIGLIRAIEKFDPERGYKLSTYAYRWIMQAINRSIQQNGRTIRLPCHLAEKVPKLYEIRLKLAGELQREPTREELAAALEWSLETLEHVLIIGRRTLSIDSVVPDAGVTLADTISDKRGNDDHLHVVQLGMDHKMLQSGLQMLPDRHRQAVMLRYGWGVEDGLTLAEIGHRMGGISRERVRQLVNEGLLRLRVFLRPQDEQPVLAA